jgi:endo-alpha-1,4-polygalactosaminidase (GH114 family)
MSKSLYTILLIFIVGLFVVSAISFTIIPTNQTTKSTKIREVKVDTVENKKPKLNILNKDKYEQVSWAYYLKDPVLLAIETAPFSLFVIDVENENTVFTKEQISKLQKTKKVFAYLSLGDAEDYRSYWKPLWNQKKPKWLGNEHPLWKGNFSVQDLLNKEWLEITKQQLDNVISVGYDGIVISGLGLPDSNKFLTKIQEYLKSKKSSLKVYVQDYIYADSKLIDGVVKQGLIYNIDGSSSKATQQELKELLKYKNEKKEILVVEYVTGEKWEQAKKIIQKYEFSGYSGPLELNVIRFKQ